MNLPLSSTGRRRIVRMVSRAAFFAAGLALASCGGVRGDEDKLIRTGRELVSGYTARLEELAAWCDQRKLASEAQKTRAWLRPPEPGKVYLTVLPDKTTPAALPEGTPAEVVEWDARFGRLRRQQSNALFELARRAAFSRRASLAYELVLMAIREDPDHEKVRRLLGYQRFRGGWHTRYEVRKLRTGHVWHEQFGWLPKSHVRRYEQGQRHHQGRWIDAAEDAKLHRDILNGWDVESEHYTIRTNHSIEAGVKLGVKLEQLYRVWKQLFVRFYATEADVVAAFGGRAQNRHIKLPRHHVVFFRDREDYNRSLREVIPNIGMSIGVYMEASRRAYFFAGEDYSQRTLYHEATHQLFHESRPVPPGVGRRANFWIVEGIAMFMESLRRQDGYYTLGGFDDDRMVAARYRLLNDDFYVPLAELTTYGMTRLQEDKRIATLYSQATGLTHFLAFYQRGRYRDALVAYLTAVYSGRDDPATLARLTRTPYDELDKQYRQFMEEGR